MKTLLIALALLTASGCTVQIHEYAGIDTMPYGYSYGYSPGYRNTVAYPYRLAAVPRREERFVAVGCTNLNPNVCKARSQ